MVILSHILASLPAWRSTSGWAAVFKLSPLKLLTAGGMAVDFFFVLSGFVLALPYVSGKRQRYGAFIIRRWFRIYVPYVTAVGVAFALYLTVPSPEIPVLSGWFNAHWEQPLTQRLVVNHLLLVVDFNANEYSLAFWTLVHEMRVALLFPLIMWFTLRTPSVAVAGIACAAATFGTLRQVAIGGGLMASTTPASSLFFGALFVFGALIAKHRDALEKLFLEARPSARRAAIVAALFIGPYAWWTRRFIDTDALAEALQFSIYTVAVAVLMVALLAHRRTGQVMSRPAFAWLGDISYSLYLFHGVLMHVLVYTLYPAAPVWVAFTLVLPASLVVATVSQRWIERPALQAGRRVARRFEDWRALTHPAFRRHVRPVMRGFGITL